MTPRRHVYLLERPERVRLPEKPVVRDSAWSFVLGCAIAAVLGWMLGYGVGFDAGASARQNYVEHVER